jgi:hypothetical protein
MTMGKMLAAVLVEPRRFDLRRVEIPEIALMTP